MGLVGQIKNYQIYDLAPADNCDGHSDWIVLAPLTFLVTVLFSVYAWALPTVKLCKTAQREL